MFSYRSMAMCMLSAMFWGSSILECGHAQESVAAEAEKFLVEEFLSAQERFKNCCFESLSRSDPLDGFPSDRLSGLDFVKFGSSGDNLRFLQVSINANQAITDSEWNAWLDDGQIQFRDVLNKSLVLSNKYYSARMEFKDETPVLAQLGYPIQSRTMGYFEFLFPDFQELKNFPQFEYQEFRDGNLEGRNAKVLKVRFLDNRSFSSEPPTVEKTFYFDGNSSYVIGVDIKIDNEDVTKVRIEYDWTKTPPVPRMLRRVSWFSHYEQIVSFKRVSENCFDPKESFLSFYGLPEPPGEPSKFEGVWFYIMLIVGISLLVIGALLRHFKRAS